jgi:hypothetical protein
MAKKTDDTPEDPMIVIDLEGQLFAFPRDQDEWPTGSIVAASRVQSGRATYDEVVEALLGEEQWKRLKMLPFRQYKEFLRLFSANMDEINRAS